MSVYPINLDLTGRNCAVIGGGAVAERKTNSLLEAGACVTIFSPELTKRLISLCESKKIVHVPRPYQSGDIENFFVVICATDNKVVNEAVAREAREKGSLVNVADAPELCDFTVPSTIVRGDLIITISTGGQSPALAKKLRLELESRYGPEYAFG